MCWATPQQFFGRFVVFAAVLAVVVVEMFVNEEDHSFDYIFSTLNLMEHTVVRDSKLLNVREKAFAQNFVAQFVFLRKYWKWKGGG